MHLRKVNELAPAKLHVYVRVHRSQFSSSIAFDVARLWNCLGYCLPWDGRHLCPVCMTV